MTESVKSVGGAGKAVASALVPGLGQFLDGRNKEGAGYLLGASGLSFGGLALVNKYNNDVFEATTKASREIFDAASKASSEALHTFEHAKGANFIEYAKKMEKEATKNMITPEAAAKAVKKGGKYAGIALWVIGSALWLAGVVDAYKGGKKLA